MRLKLVISGPNSRNIPIHKTKKETPFNNISARSSHNKDTHNHNAMPTVPKNISMSLNSGPADRAQIAVMTKQDAAHLTYQSSFFSPLLLRIILFSDFRFS